MIASLLFNHLFIPLLLLSSSTSAADILSCGNKDGGTDADGRKWTSDASFLVSQDKGLELVAQVQDPSLPSTVPYMNARIFKTEASYKFPVNPTSRYFLRLHFYPSPYPNFIVSNSYFSVLAGPLTLLSNFSASISAQALTQSYIMKEYSLAPIHADSLTITFKPSDKYKDTFAFINGIELIPSPEIFTSAELVGFQDQPLDTSSANVETMWRLNVGGQYISPVNDTSGLSRSWYDDTPYISSAALGIAKQADDNVTIQYKNMSASIAPIDVYRTSRQMGLDGNVTSKFNLTWTFSIDAGFTYVLRLHFCEFDLTAINQRVFNIYINNQTATEDADVIAWTGAKNIPIYRDYASFVPAGQIDSKLSLALWPDVNARPEYLDAILNGVEIFKISNSNSSLAGPNPTISDLMQQQLLEEEARKPSSTASRVTKVIIGGAAGGAAVAFAFVATAVFVAKRKRALPPGSQSRSRSSSWLPIYGGFSTASGGGSKSTISGKSHAGTNISSDAVANCRYFSIAEIYQATKHFDESNVIGVGGFGKVYKGTIDGNVKVAIKRSNPSSEQGVNEFQTEIEMLSKLRHRHLVSLIGFCEEDGEMALVYDFMGKGTMREHLYKGNKIILSWKQRLELCIGAARGLHYLHTGAKYTIIHRDVKTTNILLDDKWVAKVSDFGLSKTGPNMNQGHVSTVVKGSFGYLDPEYFRRQQLTEKSDVYSFGVVLFEVICARPALNPSLPKEQVSLGDWALNNVRKGTFEDLVDPHLKGKISPECMKKFVDTAQKCLADHGVDRPSMGDVLWNLEFALQMHENPEGSTKKASSGATGNTEQDHDKNNDEKVMDQSSILAMHRNTLSLNDQDFVEQNENNTDEVFSQIVNPKGR
ncbi:receptor-like protein kinase ANXUR1 [Impatiens glandulifera]|uniref:receptor-like protein kinase ANXUR1 n=1 Tax=Impatiens glandulifera TaxID=253017 RepID=UPI001FB0E878|nr:receptor-like protein kinase ANXUR1 [Impatiens glandulifera]